MAKRKKLDVVSGGNYFASVDKKNIEFFSSGCYLLDCMLGGGYPLGRVVNLVGDKSTGKTLLAIEACVNFTHKFPEAPIWYCEAEAAFDLDYAAALGMPIDKINFVEDCFTIEDLFENLESILFSLDDDAEGLFILDSLDALSSRDELKRKIDEASFGGEKAKKLSELFRRLIKALKTKKITIIIVSQVRDNIGAMFGRKTKRSGGRALDFYASQVIYLAQIKTIKKTVRKIERPVGVQIRAKCDKNKVGLPYRECDFSLLFGYGVDSTQAALEWLQKIGRLDDVGITKTGLLKFCKEVRDNPTKELKKKVKKIKKITIKRWEDVEISFLPKRGKYE